MNVTLKGYLNELQKLTKEKKPGRRGGEERKRQG